MKKNPIEQITSLPINRRIRADLFDRGHSSPSYNAKILAYLLQHKNEPISLGALVAHYGKTTASFWRSAYYLAATHQIGFADRKYHNFDSCDLLRNMPKKQRVIVWHKSLNVNAKIQIQWSSYEPVTAVQPSLFAPDDFESMSNDQLDQLLHRLTKERLDRACTDRYKGIVDTSATKTNLIDRLKKYNVADPVALLHVDDDISFLTLTETKQMPIHAIIKRANADACESVYLDHITLLHKPLIATIQEAYTAANRGKQ